MKKTNKDSRKKLLNFLNESQVRVGKNVGSLVDRLVLNNSKERAGDIGELIAELFLKNNVNSFSNVQNGVRHNGHEHRWAETVDDFEVLGLLAGILDLSLTPRSATSLRWRPCTC